MSTIIGSCGSDSLALTDMSSAAAIESNGIHFDAHSGDDPEVGRSSFLQCYLGFTRRTLPRGRG